jgi:hypothetical protein
MSCSGIMEMRNSCIAQARLNYARSTGLFSVYSDHYVSVSALPSVTNRAANLLTVLVSSGRRIYAPANMPIVRPKPTQGADIGLFANERRIVVA